MYLFRLYVFKQVSPKSGTSGTIRALNQASSVRKGHYAQYYVQKAHFVSSNRRQENISSVGSALLKSIFLNTQKV